MAQRLGMWLSQLPAPVRWTSSPARRAWDTALMTLAELDLPADALLPIPELYHAEPDTLLEAVKKQSDAAATLVLFGHNPGLTEFATQLCGRDFVNIPTAGIVGIRFATDNWAEVTYGAGEELFFDYPKKTV
jgi:phosphohistidine phosphatase